MQCHLRLAVDQEAEAGAATSGVGLWLGSRIGNRQSDSRAIRDRPGLRDPGYIALAITHDVQPIAVEHGTKQSN